MTEKEIYAATYGAAFARFTMELRGSDFTEGVEREIARRSDLIAKDAVAQYRTHMGELR